MNLVNIILNFAQFIIYRNYIRECFGSENHRMHAVYLIKELKVVIRTYLDIKCNRKKIDTNEVTTNVFNNLESDYVKLVSCFVLYTICNNCMNLCHLCTFLAPTETIQFLHYQILWITYRQPGNIRFRSMINLYFYWEHSMITTHAYIFNIFFVPITFLSFISFPPERNIWP